MRLMRRTTKIVSGVVATSAAALALLVPSAAAASAQPPVSPQACVYFAKPPTTPPGGGVSGSGGRTGCGTSSVTLQVVVNKDVPGFDIQAAERTFRGFVTGTVTAVGNCRGNGNYYTEVRVLGTSTKVQSDRVRLC